MFLYDNISIVQSPVSLLDLEHQQSVQLMCILIICSHLAPDHGSLKQN